jgi:hypothetical protein
VHLLKSAFRGQKGFPTTPPRGDVRLHGLTSSPTPDTHVREARAYAAADIVMRNVGWAKTLKRIRILAMYVLVILSSFEKCRQLGRRRGRPYALQDGTMESRSRKASRAKVASEVFQALLPAVRSGKRFYAKFAELSMAISI